jgi:hypothetical protein
MGTHYGVAPTQSDGGRGIPLTAMHRRLSRAQSGQNEHSSFWPTSLTLGALLGQRHAEAMFV